jgi:hypothetical protein
VLFWPRPPFSANRLAAATTSSAQDQTIGAYSIGEDPGDLRIRLSAGELLSAVPSLEFDPSVEKSRPSISRESTGSDLRGYLAPADGSFVVLPLDREQGS